MSPLEISADHRLTLPLCTQSPNNPLPFHNLDLPAAVKELNTTLSQHNRLMQRHLSLITDERNRNHRV